MSKWIAVEFEDGTTDVVETKRHNTKQPVRGHTEWIAVPEGVKAIAVKARMSRSSAFRDAEYYESWRGAQTEPAQ